MGVNEVQKPNLTSVHVAWALLVVVCSVFAGVVVWQIAAADPYDPFDYSPLWSVEFVDELGAVRVPQVPGFEAPSVTPDEEVTVRGIRCNQADSGVDAVANVWWERTDGRNTGRVEIADAIVVQIEDGCTTVSFTVPVDDSIGDDINESGVPQVWKIAGNSTPVAENAVTASWESENIIIVPETLVGMPSGNPHGEP